MIKLNTEFDLSIALSELSSESHKDQYINIPRWGLIEEIENIFKSSKTVKNHVIDDDNKISVNYLWQKNWSTIQYELDTKNLIAKYKGNYYKLSRSNYEKLKYAIEVIRNVFEHNRLVYLKLYKQFEMFRQVVESDSYMKQFNVKLEIDDRYGKIIEPENYTMDNDVKPYFNGMIHDKYGSDFQEFTYYDPIGFINKVKEKHQNLLNPKIKFDKNPYVRNCQEKTYESYMDKVHKGTITYREASHYYFPR